MRTPHWLKPLAICFLVVLAGSQADAQYPGMPGPSGINAQGLPPGAYNPYPAISPYEQSISRTYNQGGNWFNESRGMLTGGRRNWTMNIDWVTSRQRKLEGLVGAPNTNTYLDDPDVVPADDVAGDASFDVFDFFNYFDAANARAMGDVHSDGLRISGGFTDVAGPGFVFDVEWNPSSSAVYNPKNALANQRYAIWDQPGLIGNRAQNEAIVNFLLTNPSKLQAEISPPWDWNADVDGNFFQNDGTESGLLQRNLYNLHGIPIQNAVDLDGNGVIDPDLDADDTVSEGNFGGVTVPYDILYKLEHRHESFKVGMGFAMSPIVRTGGFTVTPIVSGRYMYVGEDFLFRGIDSGLNYTSTGGTPTLFKEHSRPDGVDDGGDGIVDNAGVSDDGGGGGGGSFVGGNNAATTDTSFSLINPDGLIRSDLTNAVKTHLAGPEVSLRYQVGGSDGGLNISGQTKVGLMINREKINLSGNNIGNFMAFDEDNILFDATTGGVLTEVFPTNSTIDDEDNNFFSDEKINTHVSPLFEQSFNAEIPLFSSIPVLNRVRQLEGAKFRVGYSWLWIGEVASPNRSILWQANPQAGLFPKIKLDRESYYTSSWNFGVNWDF